VTSDVRFQVELNRARQELRLAREIAISRLGHDASRALAEILADGSADNRPLRAKVALEVLKLSSAEGTGFVTDEDELRFRQLMKEKRQALTRALIRGGPELDESEGDHEED